MTLLYLLKQARRYYPTLSLYDLLIAGLEELLYQNNRKHYQDWIDKSEKAWAEWAAICQNSR